MRKKKTVIILGYESEPEKFHFSLQARNVFTSLRNLYADIFPDAFDYFVILKINLFRKVQFTYSIRPDLEMGAAWIAFGEPCYNSYNLLNRVYSWFNLYEDDYDFYAVMIHTPFDHILSYKREWGVE
ncbi:MAG: hypothetical protein JW755_01640 [Candidatus Aminicenantes bacterium]|nr:hypothetical protein [Candidatus Aminicenantes bacterium]